MKQEEKSKTKYRFIHIGLPIFEHYQDIIDNELKLIFKQYLSQNKFSKVLYDAMYYSVFSGGKRIRPILCCLTYQTLLESSKSKVQKSKTKNQMLAKILPFACGIELIHTFSLIQDDLPSMDNDDFRRGKPSLHKAYGEAIAILASDALFALAFELFARAPVEDSIKVSAITELTRVCGVKGLVAGQTQDILMQNKKKTLRQQEILNQMKTAELMAGAMKIAGIVSQCQNNVIKNIENAGRSLGLLFQTVDDILDTAKISKAKRQKAEYYAHKAIHYIKLVNPNTALTTKLTETKLPSTEHNKYLKVSDFSWFIDFVHFLLNTVRTVTKA